MDAARAAMGQGWPFAAGPRSNDGVRGVERSETRMQGHRPFGSFWGVCCTDRRHSGRMCGDMVDTLWPLIVRHVQVDGSKMVMTKVQVK